MFLECPIINNEFCVFCGENNNIKYCGLNYETNKIIEMIKTMKLAKIIPYTIIVFLTIATRRETIIAIIAINE